MRDAEVLSNSLIVEELKPEKGELQEPKSEKSDLDRIKAKLTTTMTEERAAAGRHDKLLIAQLELTAQVAESEAKLDQLATKKAALQTQATDLARKSHRNGKGK